MVIRFKFFSHKFVHILIWSNYSWPSSVVPWSSWAINYCFKNRSHLLYNSVAKVSNFSLHFFPFPTAACFKQKFFSVKTNKFTLKSGVSMLPAKLQYKFNYQILAGNSVPFINQGINVKENLRRNWTSVSLARTVTMVIFAVLLAALQYNSGYFLRDL